MTFWVLMFLLILTHLAHISSFYSIKTYNDTLDLKAVRSNFVNVTEQTKPVIIAEVKFEFYLFRRIPLKDGGIAMSKLSTKSIWMEIIAILDLPSNNILSFSLITFKFMSICKQ